MPMLRPLARSSRIEGRSSPASRQALNGSGLNPSSAAHCLRLAWRTVLIYPPLLRVEEIVVAPEQAFTRRAARCLRGYAALVAVPGEIVPDDAHLPGSDIALDKLW